MESKYILLICAGGVFGVLLFFYLLVALERSKMRKRQQRQIQKEYADKSLAKMEYDLAFYDDDTYKKIFTGRVNRQVTIDDLLNEVPVTEEDDSEKAEKAILTFVDSDGIEVIRGTYNPESVNR